MPRSNIARRYAQGVFQLAEAEHDFDGWRRELTQLDALLQDDVLRAAFANPAVTTPRRMELAQRLAPELRPETQNLLRLLIEHRRSSEMPAIRREFERMADEAAGIVNVALTTAVELDDSERKRYERALAERLGKSVRMEYRHDPALVAGATVQIGDRLIDGSVRTQLDRLRQQLVG
ncbi:MAG: F0F1 ATP synthase subunit delta [Chloroflexi bacterium]|nr:MAG: F0F1 ATP synthase subunit delta [Chloroflexota bacterium]TMD83260.1 MAG: F0F1 ATP synthase subunit delta [Chloroflexota bacterium]